jgi:hypothetical protein
MALLDKQVTQMGPLLRLQWHGDGEPPEAARQRGNLWLERAILEDLRNRLVPMSPPDGHPSLHGSPCWVWTGPVDGDGRGIVYNQGKGWTISRLLYTIEFGPLGERTMLYTACGVPRCCNPHHFVPVDRGPVRRSPFGFTQTRYPRCRNGHAMTPENTYLFEGKPMCRDCRAAAQRRYRGRTAGGSSRRR